MPVPPAKEVDVTVVGIDAHDMATAFRGCIAIGVNTAGATIECVVGRIGGRIGRGRRRFEERFDVVGRHDGMLEFDLGTGEGEDGLAGCQEASFTEVLEDLSKNDRFAVLDNSDSCLGSERLETHLVITHANTLRDSCDSDIPDGHVKILPMRRIPWST